MAYLDRMLAVLVLYKADLSTTETFRTLAESCMIAGERMDLFIYDNSPELLHNVPSTSGAHFRIIYHHDPTNPGVSAAFNAGARLAREMGKQWLLLLDQDTSFPVEAIAVYRDAIRQGGAEMFAPQLAAGEKLLSPCGYLAGIGFHLSIVHTGKLSLSGRAILNSGMLVRLAAFEACGGYDEQVRVDFADFTFINRFRQCCPEAVVLNLVCRHGFSNLETVDMASALGRFEGYCRDGKVAAVTCLLQFTHAFLAIRRCLTLCMRYRSCRFLAKLPIYFGPGQRTVSR